MRLDTELVRLGLARSRGHARDVLATGEVRIDGRPVTRAAATVPPGAVVTVEGDAQPWVGRAAYKLLGALEAFGPHGLHVRGRRCLDVGASTGSFTQVLLAHGAAHVVALDVGHGQLAPAIAADPRVTERSGVNIREVGPQEVGHFDVVVADLSFVSLRLVVPHLAALAEDDADLVLLVKPQFEVGRPRVGKGGVVRDPVERLEAVRQVLLAAQGAGLSVLAAEPSPLPGTGGNREYLVWVSRRPGDPAGPHRIERLLARMHRPQTPPTRERGRS